jgi:hypothetical protein
MYSGDLVRIRSFESKLERSNSNDKDDFDKTGVLVSYEPIFNSATVLVDGVVKKYRIGDLQLIKRSPENHSRLMTLSKIKYYPHQIFCDMDGVLVDFEGAASKSITEALHNPPKGLESLCEAVRGFYGDSVDLTEMKKDKRNRPEELKVLIGELFEHDQDWWSNLPFLEEGQKLWSVLSKIEPSPYLLTSPMDHNGGTASAIGKSLWIQKNLNILDNIRWDKRVIFSHNKYEFANHDGDSCVLIDDYPRKVEPFKEHGGFGILHKGNCNETLKHLEELIDGNCRSALGEDT